MKTWRAILPLLLIGDLLFAQSDVTPTIASGGGTSSATGAQTSATIGQPAAGSATDGAVRLQAGFWWPWPAPDLTITKTHSGSFNQGDTGAQYVITVANSGQKASTGIVTVTDTLPTGLVATSLTGTGWSCSAGTLTCTREDALPAGAAYPPITLSVTVANDASQSVTNTVTVSGGDQWRVSNDTATDPTTIRATSTVTLESTPNPSAEGESVVFQAQVSSSSGAPSGTVTFRRADEVLGAAPLTGGAASINFASLPLGSHSITADYGGDSAFAPAVSPAHAHTVGPIPAPSAFAATATAPSNIELTWNGVPGAASYEVHRRTSGGNYELLVNTSLTTAVDDDVVADSTHLYKVRAIGPTSTSAFSAVDWATTVIFTDGASLSGVAVKAAHVNELRRAVNAMRVAAGLAASSFSDPAPTVGSLIRAVHLTELRVALDVARSTLSLPPVSYAEPSVTAGATIIRAAQFQEVRHGVQ